MKNVLNAFASYVKTSLLQAVQPIFEVFGQVLEYVAPKPHDAPINGYAIAILIASLYTEPVSHSRPSNLFPLLVPPQPGVTLSSVQFPEINPVASVQVLFMCVQQLLGVPQVPVIPDTLKLTRAGAPPLSQIPSHKPVPSSQQLHPGLFFLGTSTVLEVAQQFPRKRIAFYLYVNVGSDCFLRQVVYVFRQPTMLLKRSASVDEI